MNFGIIAVNTATFIGYKLRCDWWYRGNPGVIAPSMVIHYHHRRLLSRASRISPAVGHAFAGVRACVCVLIFNAVVKLGKNP